MRFAHPVSPWTLLLLCLAAACATAAPLLEPGPDRLAVTFTVVDAESGQPIPKAFYEADAGDEERRGAVDKQGRVTLHVRKDTDYFRFLARPKKHVPMRVSWRPQPPEGKPIPESFTLACPKGTTIGGNVVDEAGAPVQRARVHLIARMEDTEAEVRPYAYGLVATTGKDGRWECGQMPAEVKEFWVRFEHRDYISDDVYNETAHFTETELREQTATAVLKKGITIAGTVRDETGNPIAGAEVKQGSDRWGSHYPDTRTGKDGRYAFRNCAPGPMVLTVQADGYAPELKEVTAVPGAEPADFQLGPPHTVVGRVVDIQGAPVEDAHVVADTWRGHRSISGRANTDAEGRFAWNGAPADAVEFDIVKRDYMSVRNFAMTAREEPYEITIQKPVVVSGVVTDAESGEPIASAEVVPGISWGRDRAPHWLRQNAEAVEDGAYELRFTEPRPAHYVRAEAPGYKPGISRAIQDSEEQVRVDFALEQGAGPAGQVVTGGGAPAAEAQVGMSTPGQNVYLMNDRLDEDNGLVLRTGADGRFSFPYEEGRWLVVAVHEAGYAEVDKADFPKDGRIVLEPWAGVEGTLTTGGTPRVDAEIIVSMQSTGYDPQAPRVNHYFSAKTGTDGAFRFVRLPAAPVQVAWGVPSGNGRAYSHGVLRELEPGKTERITFGGDGRPVLAKLVLPEDMEEDVVFGYGSYRLSFKPPRPEQEFDRQEEAQRWWNEWLESDAGRTWLKAQRSYAFTVEKDGSMRAEEVPPGEYTLNVSVHEPPKAGQCGWGEMLGRVNEKVTVTAAEGYAPLDLGTLELQVRKRFEVGETAPAFEVTTLSGAPLKLADYRGKHVLLDFWATWCGPCKVETPHLKEAYEAIKDRDDFVLIGLSLDEEPEPAAEYARENGMDWIQGFLGSWEDTEIPNEFGVNGIPSIFLIGPDGKLKMKNLRGAAIPNAVRQVLNETASE